MKSPLHILHLEDNSNDAKLILSTLEDGGIACRATRVQSEEDFVAALQVGCDLILSDYSLPTFDGLSALEIARAARPDLPMIFVSGTLGEERAVGVLKKGATDYIPKEGVSRLVPAVRRAMQEVEERNERRRLEAQSIEAQKIDVIGQLAGGVAHDFNNILAVIIGYCHLLGADLVPETPPRKYAEEIRHAAERAAGLTRQLLIFSRKHTVQPVVLDLNEVVRDIEQMLRRLMDANIEMAFVFGNDLGHVLADSGYVGQVLMNLVVNARDAMPRGGKITITTANVTVDETYANTPMGAFPGDYVRLSVQDTGIGMTDEVKARLFEPLFTTKSSGKGTGLGLVTCRNIVLQSGGHICFSSESGQGTIFEVYFPLQGGVRCAPPLPNNSTAAPRGTETILIVDDEPSVRQLARAILEAHGYRIVEASNGQEGLRVVQEFAGPPISLVIADVIMPLMGGKAMAEQLSITHPAIEILFMSGCTDEAITQYGVVVEGIDFLAKPYTPFALLQKVREILDKSMVPSQVRNETAYRKRLI